jgi:hypothetical protein
MATFSPFLWLLVRSPNLALAISSVVYAAAHAFGWNLASYPDGTWYFNPFAWQFLFVLGAWASLDRTGIVQWLIRSRIALYLAVLFLLIGLVITLGTRLGLAPVTAGSLVALYIPNDKTNLGPFRIVHFLSLALIVARLIPCGSPALKLSFLRPALICGERSLEVFCTGIFLAFVAHFLIELFSASIAFQLVVSVAGVAAMTAVAQYRIWIKGIGSSSNSPSWGTA